MINILKSDLKLKSKAGPEKGEYNTLPTIPYKSWALSIGYNDAFKRDPVSFYYSIKVKDTYFHVFNAARVVK